MRRGASPVPDAAGPSPKHTDCAVARGTVPPRSSVNPLTLDEALTRYQADLLARSAKSINATWPRHLLPASLLAKPLADQQPRKLRTWRLGLLTKGLAPSSTNRLSILLWSLPAVLEPLTLPGDHDTCESGCLFGFGLMSRPSDWQSVDINQVIKKPTRQPKRTSATLCGRDHLIPTASCSSGQENVCVGFLKLVRCCC